MPARARFDRDYYRVMGLSAEATDDELRKTYRRLVLRWHPDRNPGDPRAAERFREISEAYAVLIDPAKRRQYDESRRLGAGGRFNYRQEDIFRDLFANPAASNVFEELAREFERMGMRVDRHSFRQTLFGGRTVVAGGVMVITPLTPVLAAFRLARAALRAGRPASAAPASPVRAALGRLGRWILGDGTPAAEGGARDDVMLPLAVSRAEAEQGAQKRVVLNRGDDLDELLVTIPAGVRTGTKLRLRGRGRPRPDGSRSDVYLAVEIAGSGVRSA